VLILCGARRTSAVTVTAVFTAETPRAAEERRVSGKFEANRATYSRRIALLIGQTGREDGLGFADREGGKTLLLLEHFPERHENSSDNNRRASPPMH
jgi:hypothetical protein